ncbi:MAG: prepilin-type N-terminal cleavage/methylation domain-containing protein [Patiriisocius sp.]|jgi:prepilin-type N-terminal cleavage/methylation domain-containing protein
MQYHTHNQGYSLVEVLVAIAILLLSLVGPLAIASKSLQSTYYSREQTTAIFLAQEGVAAFYAARNDHALEFFNGDIADAWTWTSDSSLNNCYTNGCNLDFASSDPLSNIESCSTAANCTLFFNASANRSQYNITSGDTTQYRRIIVLDQSNPGEMTVESTVYWNAQLFNNTEQSVTLTGAVYDIY